MAAVLALAEQVNDLARRIPNENLLHDMVVAAMKDEEDRLTKLVRQASKVLCVLVEKGVMSQAELNEATRPPDG